ncbi:MAG: 50S ribosomal protein L31 [bacterium]
MKNDIHPKYNKNITIKCGCGATFETGSTSDDIKVEICSACHPFYTGKQKLLDTAGRVDKFKARVEAAQKMQDALKKPAVKEIKEVKPAKETKTVKEIPAAEEQTSN